MVIHEQIQKATSGVLGDAVPLGEKGRPRA